MHNARMTRGALAALALTVGLTGALSACGSDKSKSESSPESGAEQDSEATATELSFGEAETVTWEPAGDLSGELSIQVDTVRKGRFADFEGLVASGITEANQPYYVDVVIANEGDAEVGGLEVPLYLVDSKQTLTPPSKFTDPFKPCASGPLPSSFGAGDKTQMCLVFFGSPSATFQSITFQPDVDTAAVAWTGKVDVPAPASKPKEKPKRR